MRSRLTTFQAAVCGLSLAAATLPAAAAEPPRWQIPTAVKTLDNGLTVVVSEDHTSPTFGISVIYDIGFRLEPRGRTGFAHLFEHMMFEGTPVSPKGTLVKVIESGGGVLNGSTRYDYTNYISSAPVSALEPILWLEADRMKTLDFSEENLANQQEVVKEEVRVNVHNRPYGGFFWIDINDLAFDKWENAHDGYGSFDDLDAATVADVEAFHRTFYAPNNAVIGITGDVDAAEVFRLAEKYFGGIPKQPRPEPVDVSEPLNTEPRSLTQSDQYAKVPGLVVAWKSPAPDSPDFYPAAVLGELLVAGDASRLYQRLVKDEEKLLQLQGGLGWPLGSFLSVDGPALLEVFGLYKPTTDAGAVVASIQDEVDSIAASGVDAEALARTKTKMLSDFFSGMEPLISRADTLARRQLFTGDAATINDVPAQIEAVTVADLKRVAGRYLTAANRSTIDRQPAAAAPAPEPSNQPAAEGGEETSR
jgi:predicted Zn-dependent peptidase